MKESIKRLLPLSARRVAKAMMGKPYHHEELQTSTAFKHIGPVGSLLVNWFQPLTNVPGWFNVDDCSHFYLILSLQSAYGTTGDMLEIGSYHGRSTAVMAGCLQPGEHIVVCDAFEGDTSDPYSNKPSPEKLLKNIGSVNPKLDPAQIIIKACLSNDLVLEDTQRFRFVHVDGGHSFEHAFFDLNFSKKYLSPGGIIALDDHHNPTFPGVAEAAKKFLAENSDMRVMADLNRHGAIGRKLYLIKTS